LKIATYNINGINGRLEILLRWLAEAQPDIVCLQELKCENNRFPEAQLKGAGYNAIWQGQKSWNGVAIIAKSEIKELRNDLPGDDDEFTHSRYIEAFVDGMVIGCIYLPNGNPWPGPKFDYKLRWFQRLTDHAQDLVNRDLPVILIGDYNVMPTELDTYKPEKYINNALFQTETRQAYKSLVDQGWTDAIRTLFPKARIYTFWDYLRDAYGRNAGLRLDHFLLNKKIAALLESAAVDKHVRGWKGTSDHAPVWIQLADDDLSEKKKTKKGSRTVLHETRPETAKTMSKTNKPEASFLDPDKDSQTVKVNGCPLTFNHLSKVYWPEDGITKRHMFNYYDQVAEYMVPYLKDRPMSLNRFPNGIHGPSFYQKNVKDKVPDCMATMPHTNDKGEEKEYLVATNKASLLWMASLGCIEINPWFSRVQSPDNPDFCVIDLDPDKQHFDQVISAALEVKKVLDAIGVPAYPKTSGSTGMHIYIPLGAKYSYDQSQMFAKIVVTLVHKQIPDYTSLERMVKNRGGKMYLDFLQNRPDATIAGVYSLRPKPGATVSMPLTWDEVKPGLTMRDFTIHNAIARLKETGDLFDGVLGTGIDLMSTVQKAQNIF
jgi:exodeoxyribonuclease III